MSAWFKWLRAFFDGKPSPAEHNRPPTHETSSSSGEEGAPAVGASDGLPIVESVKVNSGRALEHVIVVGLDFGTAYTKCIIRDALVRDPAKAHPVPFELADGWSYTVPSIVLKRDGGLASAFESQILDSEEKIDYLKMRLVAELDQQRAGAWRDGDSAGEMQVTVAWFLARVLSGVGVEIKRQWPDFGNHPGDQCFVNICVPIAYADGSRIEQCVLDALCAARSAVGPAGTEVVSVQQIRTALADKARLQEARAFCYSYPETSANLQSFLKSRARRPGLYLFADVGAGTVDVSFFQLLEDTGNEAPLRYYHASVLDAGSSRLELKARAQNPHLALADIIAAKEGRSQHPATAILRALNGARKIIHDEVARGVGDGVTLTESKLHHDRYYQLTQMRGVKIMHAGGGYALEPYGEAVRYFYEHRQWSPAPQLNPLPVPDDLEWSDLVERIPFSRLSVAYGLSFARYELEGHKFPSEMTVNPDLAPAPPAELPSAPTKDEV